MRANNGRLREHDSVIHKQTKTSIPRTAYQSDENKSRETYKLDKRE